MEKMVSNSNFYPNVGLGDLLFKYDQNEVLSILGLPEEKEIDQVNDSDYTVRFFYKALGYSFHFHYEDNAFNYSSIHSKRIILDNEDFSMITKERIIGVIKDYYLKKDLVYDEKYSFDESVNEETYSFDNIGLTIWFENNRISDICVNAVLP